MRLGRVIVGTRVGKSSGGTMVLTGTKGGATSLRLTTTGRPKEGNKSRYPRHRRRPTGLHHQCRTPRHRIH